MLPKTVAEVAALGRRVADEFAANLRNIVSAPSPRSEDNTLLPLDRTIVAVIDAIRQCRAVSALDPQPEVRDAGAGAATELSSLWHTAILSRELYEAVEGVEPAALESASRHFRAVHLQRMELAGALLDESARQHLARLARRESELASQFHQNLQRLIPTIELEPEHGDGLPAGFLARQAKAAAGDAVTLAAMPCEKDTVMAYARSSDVRRRMELAYRDRGRPDNESILHELLEVRAKQARQLGYPSPAHHGVAENMLSDPLAVEKVLGDIDAATTRAAEALRARLLARKRRDEPEATALLSWDVNYYVTCLRAEELAFDCLLVRRYFDFERTLQGLLACCNRLFGVAFVFDTQRDVWHPDVRVCDVVENHRVIGRLYLDLHAREGKCSGGRYICLRSGLAGGAIPEGAVVIDLPHGALELDQVRRLFHEMGHFLHHLFSGAANRYGSQAATGCELDFTEVPSILLERWALDPEVLRGFCAHEESGEPVPDELARLMLAANALSQPVMIRNLLLQGSWLALHAYGPEQPPNWTRIWSSLRHLELGEAPPETRAPAYFVHLVGMGPAYYAYAWSVVLAAEIDRLFAEQGRFHGELAQRLRHEVLEQTGRKPAWEVIRAFLGGEPPVAGWRGGWIPNAHREASAACGLHHGERNARGMWAPTSPLHALARVDRRQGGAPATRVKERHPAFGLRQQTTKVHLRTSP